MGGKAKALVGLLATVVAAAGCSTVTDYPDQTKLAADSFAKGQFDAAYQKLEEYQGDLDKVCYTLEKAMVSHTAGDYAKSNEQFKTALGLFEKYEQESTGAEVADVAATLLLNEKAAPYKGEMFEKALIHVFWGINYLCTAADQKTLDEANVEIRRANQRLKEMREEYEEDLAEARGETKAEGEDGTSLDTTATMSAITEKMDASRADQEAIVKSVQNVYEMAFAHYLTGLVYEEQADRGYAYELDNARISYEKVYEMNPKFPYVLQDLMRVSKKLRDQEAYDKWKGELGGDWDWDKQPGTGEIVVLYQCGLAPVKEEIAIRFPVFIPGVMTSIAETIYGKIAIPKYASRPTQDAYVTLEGLDAQSHVLTDCEATAIKFLWDRMALIGFKMAVRFTIKAAAAVVAQKAAMQAGGPLAMLGAKAAFAVFSEISEQADLRSWLLLPRNLQVARVTVPAGEQSLTVNVHGQGGGKLNSIVVEGVNVPEGRRVFVNVRSVGPNLFANVARPAKAVGGEPKWGSNPDSEAGSDGENASTGSDKPGRKRRVFDFGGKRR